MRCEKFKDPETGLIVNGGAGFPHNLQELEDDRTRNMPTIDQLLRAGILSRDTRVAGELVFAANKVLVGNGARLLDPDTRETITVDRIGATPEDGTDDDFLDAQEGYARPSPADYPADYVNGLIATRGYVRAVLWAVGAGVLFVIAVVLARTLL